MRFAAIAATLGLAIGLAHAEHAAAMARHPTDIVAQDLAPALRMLAQERGLHLISLSEDLEGKKTRGAGGNLTDREAIQRLLEGTGLTYRYIDAQTVSIFPANSATRPPAEHQNTVSSEDGAAGDDNPQGVQSKGFWERLRLAQVSPGGSSSAAALSSGSQGPGQGGPVELEEIVVTAQRRAEQILDVPVAVTTLNAQSLLSANNVSLNDYFQSVPGLTLFDNGEGFKQLVIRGITTGQGNTPTTGIYIDETPVGSSTAAARGDVLVPDIDPNDLSRIEVLKGPQGTLYGASNMGGVLRYITVAPDTRDFSGRLEVDGSTVEHGGNGYGARAVVNIPVIPDELAVRISGSTREDPGYIKNVAPGGGDNVNLSHVDNGRIAVLWHPSEAITVNFSAMIQERDAEGSGREDYDPATRTLVYGDLEQSRVAGEYDHERQQIYNATVDVKFDWATLTSSTSFASNHYSSNSDLTPLFGPLFQSIFEIPDFGVNLQQRFSTNKVTEESRLTGSAGNVDWVGGVFYTRESSIFYQNFASVQTENDAPLEGLPPLGYGLGDSHYNEAALFEDLTYHFTPQLSVQEGLRYSYNWQDSSYLNSAGVLNDASTGAGTSHQGVVTFVFAPEYKLSENAATYGRIASGYRAGGPNFTLSGAQIPFKSDSTVNYELGAKSFLLEHKAYVELAAFYIAWKDIQLLGLDSLDETFFKNAGGAFSRGLEYSGQYHPFTGLTLASNFTFTEAQLTDPAPAGIAALSGARLPYAPRLAGQVSADYSHPLSRDWSGSVGADFSYMGDRQSEFQPTFSVPRIDLPSYTVTNLRAGLDNERYAVVLFAKNIFDRRGFESAAALSLDKMQNYAIAVIQPRTLGVSFTAKF